MLITAGPTHERIDDVRYLANRSSGRMGIALAEAACGAGFEVTLLLGPVPSDPKHRPGRGDRLHIERFESTADLQALLDRYFPLCDVLVMAAAVADYRPVTGTPGKLPRRGEKLILELEPTPDLVAGCAARRRPDQRTVAFALEQADQMAERVLEKMRAKGVDALVANPLDTMGSRLISGVIYTADGQTIAPEIPTLEKNAFAAWLIRWIQDHLH